MDVKSPSQVNYFFNVIELKNGNKYIEALKTSKIISVDGTIPNPDQNSNVLSSSTFLYCTPKTEKK